MNYTLEFLEEKFKEHSNIFKNSLAAHKKNREENGWDGPDYDEEFCLPDALVLIIQEIKKLKGE